MGEVGTRSLRTGCMAFRMDNMKALHAVQKDQRSVEIWWYQTSVALASQSVKDLAYIEAS